MSRNLRLLDDVNEVLGKLDELIDQAGNLDRRSFHALKDWKKCVLDLLQSSFVDEGIEKEFEQTGVYRGNAIPMGGGTPKFVENLPRAVKYLRVLREDIASSNQDTATEVDDIAATTGKVDNNRVFVVHGHDDGLKQEVSRTLERLGLEPIILSGQPNGGRTVIEKFEHNSVVGFSVILMSADDVGRGRLEPEGAVSSRARQNVILELGYFIGKLGRNRVFVIKEPNVSQPSDIHGIVYEPVVGPGSWKLALHRELLAAGYGVDANKL